MKTQAQKWTVGQHLWEIEWCHSLGKQDEGEFDSDACLYNVSRKATEEEAMAEARRVYPLDKFGSVRITEVVAVDDFGLGRVTSFEAVREHSEHYEGE